MKQATKLKRIKSRKKQQLILDHIKFAKKIARQFCYIDKSSILEPEDFEGAAMLGLCDAASRFDSKKMPHFRTYAFFRIRGAMFDLLRQASSVPKAYYDMMKKCSQAAAADTKGAEGNGKDNSEGQPIYMPFAVARSVKELNDLSSLIAETNIDIHINNKDGTVDLSYLNDCNSEEQVCMQQAMLSLRELITKLPRREKRVIEEYYYKEKPLNKIVKRMKGITASSASRTHLRALNMLQALYVADEERENNILAA